MDELLKELYNACHPLLPASTEQYVDFTEVRGGGVFIKQICQEFDESDEPVSALFTGHLGSGKSSELEQLAYELRRHGPECRHRRYFPVVVNAVDYLDIFDASLLEILLAIVAEIALQLKEKEGIELKSGYFQKRWEEIRRSLFSDVEVKEAELPLWMGKAKLGLKEADRNSRKQLRERLETHQPTLINEINLLLISIRDTFAQKLPRDAGPKYQDIVIIVDNLDRIQQVAGKAEGVESERALFVDGAKLLNEFRANVIYTIPLGMVRAIEPQLEALYGRRPFILPNVKTEGREGHEPFDKGRAKLTEMLLKRAKKTPIDDVITPEGLKFLLDYCGGHVRQFMIFVRQATLETNVTPIDLKSAEKAVQKSVTMYSTTIKTEQWEMLAELDLSESKSWDNNDPARRELLENLCVLEYMNGGENETIFEAAEPWYAVHPIVRELRLFKTARAAREQKKS